ncbi:saccharopine dehydrogenase NADP-binding domain-containing protein [Sphaerisporangium perillae]|uniref:saccharopine dehydrogenase NADP-binding domain-containing protein n=1 Tax=Sphaerisporangium perillae TaxID=2935860 RepID=UPI00200E0AF4|nr:saccharopine dehydrogenase NADP-binding domain-containing protein [Sphaerisporangium perillae]
MTTPLIAIYGATGHTGRLVAAELHARGQHIVLAGRDATALQAMADELGARAHPAAVDDPASLRELAESATVLINCAGPFSVTGEPVASAAAEAGCHYIDHAVEPHHVKRVFDTLQAPAQRTGATMIPALSFYGGLGDLLAAAVADGMTDVERVTIAYAVTGWRMTTGALNTARQLFAETQRIGFSDGALRVGYVEPRNAVFAFPPPLGPRTMIAPVPFPEAITIPRHVPARHVEAMLTARTFEEEQVFTSEDAGAEARAATDFTVAVQAITDHGGRAGQITGHDLWRAGALASVEGAMRLLGDDGAAKSGVLSAAEVFPAEPFLRELERLGAFTVTL